MRKVIYLVPSNTAVAMVSRVDTAHQPTGADAGADACTATVASAKPDTAPPAYDLPKHDQAVADTARNGLFAGRFALRRQKAPAGRAETEEATEGGEQPSQLPSESAQPLGEREMEASASRDGDSAVFVYKAVSGDI